MIPTDALEHTKKIEELLAEGKVSEAAALHNAHLDKEFRRAEAGETINLSDLMAAKETLDQAAEQNHKSR